MSSDFNEPEILVPPDMENFEIEEIPRTKKTPFMTIIYTFVSILGMMIFFIIGLVIFLKTKNLEFSLPFWGTGVIILPFALYFIQKLVAYYDDENPHERL